MKKIDKFLGILALCTLLMSSYGCSGKTSATVPPTDPENTSASAIIAAAVGGVVNATSATGSSALYRAKPQESLLAKVKSHLSFFPEAVANIPPPIFGPCAFIQTPGGGTNGNGTACSVGGPNNNMLIFTYGGCNYSGSSASWFGTQIITLTTGTTTLACLTFPGFVNGDIATRTFGLGTYRQISGIDSIKSCSLETSSVSNGWQTPVVTSGETITFTGGGAGTIVINGLHVAYNINSYVVWDDMITSTSMTVNAANAVSSGVVTVQLNKTQDVATANVSGLSFTGCCFPTASTITTNFLSGTSETMVFGPACGAATLNGTPVRLTHCF